MVTAKQIITVLLIQGGFVISKAIRLCKGCVNDVAFISPGAMGWAKRHGIYIAMAGCELCEIE